jgi:hypothetical protein
MIGETKAPPPCVRLVDLQQYSEAFTNYAKKQAKSTVEAIVYGMS